MEKIKFAGLRSPKMLGLLVLGLIITVSSCNKSAVDPLVDGESALLDLMFLATGEDSTNTFRGPQGHCNMTEVAVADLPSVITDYISANYPNATIEHAGTGGLKFIYAVGIKKEDGTFAGLFFDKDGNFLHEKSRKHKGEMVAVADLPSAVVDYINANYAGATIHRVLKHDDGKYGVLLILADESYQAVGFDADGNFVGELSMKDKKGHKHGPGRNGPFGN